MGVAPDTRPRPTRILGENDDGDLGNVAGFDLDATLIEDDIRDPAIALTNSQTYSATHYS